MMMFICPMKIVRKGGNYYIQHIEVRTYEIGTMFLVVKLSTFLQQFQKVNEDET